MMFIEGLFMHRLVCAAILLPCVLSAQAILTHGIAVGVGTTAGTTIGKQVSSTLDAVRAAEESAANDSSDPTLRRKKDEWKRFATADGKQAAKPAGVSPLPAVGSATNAPAPRSRSFAARVPVRPAPSNGGTMWFSTSVFPAESSQATPPPPEPSIDDLRAMAAGTARDTVVDTLGTPTARVTIPESGRFVEIYYYHAKGESLGAVRLSEGAVTEVQLAR